MSLSHANDCQPIHILSAIHIIYPGQYKHSPAKSPLLGNNSFIYLIGTFSLLRTLPDKAPRPITSTVRRFIIQHPDHLCS